MASAPVASPRRLAARPVGAASASRRPLRVRIWTTARTRVVFPVPGPPVMTSSFEVEGPATWPHPAREPVELVTLFEPGERPVDVDLWGCSSGLRQELSQTASGAHLGGVEIGTGIQRSARCRSRSMTTPPSLAVLSRHQRLDQIGLDFEQSRSLLDQQRSGKIDVAFVGRPDPGCRAGPRRCVSGESEGRPMRAAI